MALHDEAQELIPGYALGALDAPDVEMVRSHLGTCAECRRLLQEYQAVADQIALAVPQAEPPRELKTRTMQRALERPPGEMLKGVAPRRRWVWPRLELAIGLAGVAVAITVVTLLWSVWQTSQLRQELATQRDFTTVLAYADGSALDIHGTEAAPLADGKLYVDVDANVAALITVDLPPLTPGHVYQAWLVDPAGQKVSGGAFQVDSSGSGWLLMRAPRRFGEYEQVQVTVEPASGTTVQTSRPILAAQLKSP